MTIGYIELENGMKLTGNVIGYNKSNKSISGELVFQTGMVGYVETLTDPSYSGQILVFTYPMIGNYGVGGESNYFESTTIHPSGIIVSEMCKDPSHYSSKKTFNDWLIEHKIVGLENINTRLLTETIRDYGSMKARIVVENDEPVDFVDISTVNLVSKVSCLNYDHNSNGATNNDSKHILAIDLGMKMSQLEYLRRDDVIIHVRPHDYEFIKELDMYNGIFLSNGPGNPEMNVKLIAQIKYIIDNKINIPIFGICLGHQILALASDNKTYKLKYGNRGHNQPVGLVNTKRCLLTSQNHGYAVSVQNNEWEELFVNLNDESNEGMCHKELPYWSVQFHPESHGGPNDSRFLFDIFNLNVDNGNGGNVRKLIDNYLPNVSEIKDRKIYKILILGSGGLSIGQAGEFDYSGSQAIKAYKQEKYEVVLINPNIATIQTSTNLADKIYYLPVNPKYVSQVIELEKPDAISVSFGGQTALNCGVELYRSGFLQSHNVTILGTPIESVIATEDRQVFKEHLAQINLEVAPSKTVKDMNDAYETANQIGYPVLVRSAFALGGLGSGFAHNDEELKNMLSSLFANGSQVMIDRSLKGWKELEYEVVRDCYDNCLTICNMENFDPVGVHTGESIVVAPSQTLTDTEYQMLRDAAITAVRHFKIVGECNIQYALDPNSNKFYVIEINARLSRSSALASKATGYPLAYIAAKLSLGKSLSELKNNITGTTSAYFEPSMDYCAVKIPRWDLCKFTGVTSKIGSAMKSVGEIMSIGRNFEETIQKGLRMVYENVIGFDSDIIVSRITLDDLINPSYNRIFILAKLFNLYINNGLNPTNVDDDIISGVQNGLIEFVNKATGIDKWFLNKLFNITKIEHVLSTNKNNLTPDNQYNNCSTNVSHIIRQAKTYGLSDAHIARLMDTIEPVIYEIREKNNIFPTINKIDTVAGEFPCNTNYMYLSYSNPNPNFNPNININVNNGNTHKLHNTTDPGKSIIVLGSGVYRIGSSVEFDWCAVNCVREIRRNGIKTIMVNNNPETVSTDYDEVDTLYFDELSTETIQFIYNYEKPRGVILSMGGQQPNNIAMALYRNGVKILGTSPENIDIAENRYKFSRLLDNNKIDQPLWREFIEYKDIVTFCETIGFPCLVRPSYVLSGAAMKVVYSKDELERSLSGAVKISRSYPVVVSQYITGAKEIEVDAIAKDGWVNLLVVSEHVENAGIHSGDATLILPPQDLNEETIKQIRRCAYQISNNLKINGPFNIQFLVINNVPKVIECNVRVSRSFPFVSKVMNENLVAVATRLILDLPPSVSDATYLRFKKRQTPNNLIGVKVPQFSFNRLPGADIKLGVEMVSTGEVACFGKNIHQAYIKALESAGYKMPPPNSNLFISIGSYKHKKEFENSIRIFNEMGYKLFGTYGTTDYYNSLFNSPIMTFMNESNVYSSIMNKFFKFIIIISDGSKMNSGNIGYNIRRYAIDYNVSILTDIKTAKLFAKSISRYPNNITVDEMVDSKTSNSVIRIPLLVDLHSHIRDFNENHKEDWTSGTMSALSGGFGLICAMGNTKPPVDNLDTLIKYNEIAKNCSHIYYKINFLATPQFVESHNYMKPDEIHNYFMDVAKYANGLKMFLDHSHGSYLLENIDHIKFYFKHWIKGKMILLHATGKSLATALYLLQDSGHKVHVCHISSILDLDIVQLAKSRGLNITCEVTPHHLLLDNAPNLKVCPHLMDRKERMQLWTRLNEIDCIATDHAPHLLKESQAGSPGFTSFEQCLGIMLHAVYDLKLLTLDSLINKLCIRPLEILEMSQFDIARNFVEVDMDHVSTVSNNVYSKSDWNVYTGFTSRGLIKKVVIDDEVLYRPNNIISKVHLKHNNNLESDIEHLSATDLIDLNNINDVDYNDNDELILVDTDINNHFKQFKHKDLITVEQFDRNLLSQLFNRVDKLKTLHNKPLANKIVATLFLEASTRTKTSFSCAALKMGASYIDVNPETSSIGKGESIYDTAQTIACYADLLCIRSSQIGLANEIAKHIKIPVINSGDGIGEHPTQGLLDLYTIRQERGSITGLTITFVGDLKNGRTVHSLAKLLCNYNNIGINYVSHESLRIPDEIKEYISKCENNVEQTETSDLNSVLQQTDILYVTRIQKERFEGDNALENYNKCLNHYRITPQVLAQANPKIIIMHPLPRNDEIHPDVDKSPGAAYFRQMENGLYVRMAILEMLML